ncbi:MAG: hypothetical protein HQ567_03905 [Candidatus Nealsonbacteria bacterium]|nr:hypothetical protein [Candidatus Nealsonbacteria bacterium]
MSEHDESLQKALEENARLRSQREESLREVASTEYSGHLRAAERIYWVYALVCVAMGVSAINFFARSSDIKTLIGSAVVILVLFGTTVLMKLWFATAAMKMSVLKDMKLLRLEVARLATAVGVEESPEPPVKYEPMQGASRLERRLWIVACMIVAIAVSSWTAQTWHLGGGGDSSTDTLVTLAADGSAEKQTETVSQYSSYYRPSGFSLYAPKDWGVRLLDPMGQEMPIEVAVTDKQHRHDVTFTESVFVDGKMRYTQVSEVPKAANLKDGVWTYREGKRVAGFKEKFSIKILLPPGAKLLSAEPTADVDVDEDGRTHLRYQGTTIDDKQYVFTIRYEVAAASGQQE